MEAAGSMVNQTNYPPSRKLTMFAPLGCSFPGKSVSGADGALAAEPGGGMRKRIKRQTVWAQRVFASPVLLPGDRGSLSGRAALSFDSFLWARKEKNGKPAGIAGYCCLGKNTVFQKIAILQEVEYTNQNNKMLPIFHVLTIFIHLPDKNKWGKDKRHPDNNIVGFPPFSFKYKW